MVAVIRESQADTLSQIPFQSQIPFLNVWILVMKVGGLIKAIGSRLGDVGWPSVGQLESWGSIGPDRVVEETDIAGLDGPRTDRGGTQERLNELSVSASQDSLIVAENPPREAHPR